MSFRSTSRWYDLDKVITTQFPGWTYFETHDAYYKTNSRILPFTGEYKQVHLVVSDATVIFGKSLSQSSQGQYEYKMNLMDARVRLYPLSLKFVFKDHRKSYTVVFKYVGDYKFMIGTLTKQLKQQMSDREEYLKLTIKHLHRQNALCVASEKEVPCDELSRNFLEETNKDHFQRPSILPTASHSTHTVYTRSILAQSTNLIATATIYGGLVLN